MFLTITEAAKLFRMSRQGFIQAVVLNTRAVKPKSFICGRCRKPKLKQPTLYYTPWQLRRVRDRLILSSHTSKERKAFLRTIKIVVDLNETAPPKPHFKKQIEEIIEEAPYVYS